MEVTETGTSLHRVANWNHNYLISTLISSGDRLLVGDALTSVSLLKVTGSGVELIAKDYGSLWPTCAQMVDEKSIVGANVSHISVFLFGLWTNEGVLKSDYNMLSFRLQQSGLQTMLERDGHYFLGDIVNKFVPGTYILKSRPTNAQSAVEGAVGSYEVSADTPMEAKQLFFTPTGQIGVMINMSDELSLHMTELQRNLSSYYERKEGVSHCRYVDPSAMDGDTSEASLFRFRAPKNSRGRSDSEATSFGFLDGDFLERFLLFLHDPQALHQIMEGQSEPERLKISVQRIQTVLERLQSMH